MVKTFCAERTGAVHLTVTADTWEVPAGSGEIAVPLIVEAHIDPAAYEAQF